ncbi:MULTISPECIES: DUF397 domain-containing protein [Streptomyces]|uniref:DUF397 domain-containing protein n=1 Tax=Streptomyces lycii TaxID=2654337 RepID=A0ABQ7FI04_9ACTN|nr:MULTISPECIES: DUF397 domain-containing protein [Streptomyces]KAF4408242.1 DUF397 domain-containing protein [Streptomyces lycii]PGH48942.1 DUF397 domain-containing protein [Streptomyces sp. Ru87]
MAEHGITEVWKKSSYSGANGQCVEVAARVPGSVSVRDSKDTGRPALSFSECSWEAFLSEIDRGVTGR